MLFSDGRRNAPSHPLSLPAIAASGGLSVFKLNHTTLVLSALVVEVATHGSWERHVRNLRLTARQLRGRADDAEIAADVAAEFIQRAEAAEFVADYLEGTADPSRDRIFEREPAPAGEAARAAA